MNDMFDNLKELRQKLKVEENQKPKSQKAKVPKTVQYTNILETVSEKQERLQREFKEFIEVVD